MKVLVNKTVKVPYLEDVEKSCPMVKPTIIPEFIYFDSIDQGRTKWIWYDQTMKDIVDAYSAEEGNFICLILILAAFAFKRSPRPRGTEHI